PCALGHVHEQLRAPLPAGAPARQLLHAAGSAVPEPGVSGSYPVVQHLRPLREVPAHEEPAGVGLDPEPRRQDAVLRPGLQRYGAVRLQPLRRAWPPVPRGPHLEDVSPLHRSTEKGASRPPFSLWRWRDHSMRRTRGEGFTPSISRKNDPSAPRRTVTLGSCRSAKRDVPSVTCHTCPFASRMREFAYQPSKWPGMLLSIDSTGAGGVGKPKREASAPGAAAAGGAGDTWPVAAGGRAIGAAGAATAGAPGAAGATEEAPGSGSRS